MIDNNRQVEQMIEGLEESCNLAELNRRIKEIYETFDVEKFSLASYFNAKFESFDTYPQEWMGHYIENHYYLHDPVFSWTKIRLPFNWQGSKMKNLTLIQKQLFSEAHDFGIQEGITLSLLPSANEQTFLTILNTTNTHSTMLHALSLSTYFYWKIKKKIDAKHMLCSLTTREREVLCLKAQGAPSRHVAEDLSISVPTVVFHLKNARKKLNVSTSEEVLFLIGSALGQINYKEIGSQFDQKCLEKTVCFQEKTLSTDFRSLFLL